MKILEIDFTKIKVDEGWDRTPLWISKEYLSSIYMALREQQSTGDEVI